MNKQNLRPCIGGWLLIAGGVLPAMKSIFTVLYRIIFWGMPIRYITTILGYNFLPDIVYGLPLIALGIMLVMKKQGLPVAITCGVGLVAELGYPFMAKLLGRWFGLAIVGIVNFNYYNILCSLTYVLLALVAMTSAVQNNPLKKFWWIPTIPIALAEIISFIQSITYLVDSFYFDNLLNTVLYLFFGVIIVAGFLFAGQWLADPYRKQPAYRPAPQVPQGNYYQQPQYQQPAQPQYYQPQYQQPVQPKPAATTSVVDELERAKRLLDSGAITQEEYDALKKRLLN